MGQRVRPAMACATNNDSVAQKRAYVETPYRVYVCMCVVCVCVYIYMCVSSVTHGYDWYDRLILVRVLALLPSCS